MAHQENKTQNTLDKGATPWIVASGLLLTTSVAGFLVYAKMGTQREEPQKVSQEVVSTVTKVEKVFEEAEVEAIVVAPSPKPVEALVVISLPAKNAEKDYFTEHQKLLDAGEMTAALNALRMHQDKKAPTVEVLLRTARLAREVRDYKLGAAALIKAGELDKTNFEIRLELAKNYLSAKKYKKARVAAKKAIDLSPSEPWAWNILGRIEMARSDWQRSEVAFGKAVELDPTNSMIYNNQGLLYIYMKRGEDAVDALETAVELFEGRAPHFVYNNLGLAHEMLDNQEEAREAFEEALSISPYYTKARVNLRRMEKKAAAALEASAKQLASAEGVAETSPAIVVAEEDSSH